MRQKRWMDDTGCWELFCWSQPKQDPLQESWTPAHGCKFLVWCRIHAPGNSEIQDILQSRGLGINLVWPIFSWITTQKCCKWQAAKVMFACFPVLSHGFLCWRGVITSCGSLKEKLKKNVYPTEEREMNSQVLPPSPPEKLGGTTAF